MSNLTSLPKMPDYSGEGSSYYDGLWLDFLFSPHGLEKLKGYTFGTLHAKTMPVFR